jgi:hypothetical protein
MSALPIPKSRILRCQILPDIINLHQAAVA